MIYAVFASSCGIRQSKLRCHARGDRIVADGFLWCTCVFVSSLNRKRVFGETRLWNRSAYCICDLYRLILWNNIQIFNFLMLEGCESKLKPSKSSQNKMAAVLLKSSVWHLSMHHRGCYHVIIGIKPCHQKLVLSISPRESVWGGGISPGRSGWLTTQVSGDRA